MYYLEDIINGVLCFKTFPDGAWHPCSKDRLNGKIVELSNELYKCYREIEELKEVLNQK